MGRLCWCVSSLHSTNTLQTLYKHFTNTLQTLYKHSTNTLQTLYKHSTNTLLVTDLLTYSRNQQSVYEIDRGDGTLLFLIIDHLDLVLGEGFTRLGHYFYYVEYNDLWVGAAHMLDLGVFSS